MPVEYICQRCGGTFLKHPKQRRKFCSKACWHKPAALIPAEDGSMLVPLQDGQFAVIDAEDSAKVAPYNWRLEARGYVVRTRLDADGPGAGAIRLHRVVMGASGTLDVDHIHGNKLDNRKGQLRSASRSQNRANARLQSNNTSGYRGVHRSHGKWVASVGKRGTGGKMIHVGVFDDPIAAAHAYDAAATEIHGEFARLNFPDESPESP